MKSSSTHKEDSATFSYPRPLSSIAATVCGLAVFLIMASLLLVSQPVGSAVRGYFYSVDPLVKSNLDYWSNKTIPQNFGKSDTIIDGKGNVSENNEADFSSVGENQNLVIVQDKSDRNEEAKKVTSMPEDNDFGKSDAIHTIIDGKGNISEHYESDLSNVGENNNVVVEQDISGQDEVAKDVTSTSGDGNNFPSQEKDEIDSPKSHDALNSTNLTGPNLGEGVANLTPARSEDKKSNADTGCDLYHGKWIYDSAGPLYTNNTCPVLTQTQNCQGNGRPDKDYENWRWKPSECDLPRFDPKKFLKLMRGKTLAFIGDSVARNQMESMLCILWQFEVPKNRGNKKMQRYYFRSTSTMIVRIWSSWLVHQTSEPFENAPPGIAKLHLDKPDEKFFEHIPTFDVIILSSGHWFTKQSVYILNNEIVGGQLWWPDKSRKMKVNNINAFGISVETILSSILNHPNFTGLTILRSFSPDHYEGGAWNTGGSCTGKTKPILENTKLVENGFTNIMHRKQVEGFNRAIEKKENKSKLKLLAITEVFSYRHDGHPGPYRSPDPNKKTKRGPNGRPPPQDCLHWCMPGPVDTWNEFVMEIIRREFEGNESSNS